MYQLDFIRLVRDVSLLEEFLTRLHNRVFTIDTHLPANQQAQPSVLSHDIIAHAQPVEPASLIIPTERKSVLLA